MSEYPYSKEAAEATSYLFCDGYSNAAKRLVIEQLDGKDGGGFGREAVESHMRSAITRVAGPLQAKCDRLEEENERLREALECHGSPCVKCMYVEKCEFRFDQYNVGCVAGIDCLAAK